LDGKEGWVGEEFEGRGDGMERQETEGSHSRENMETDRVL